MKLFTFLVALFLLFSCGLRYIPSETTEAYQQRRHKAIESFLKQNLGEDSSSYESIAYGQTQIIKPLSFQILDSLYAIKLENEKNHRFDKELEIQIKEQQQRAEDDTDKIKYLEFHVFKFGRTDTIQVIEAEILTDKQFKVLDEKIISSLALTKNYLEEYKQYLFEESFIYPGTSATTSEAYFYQFYKEHLASLFGTDRDEFIVHTIKIMDIAHKKKSLQTMDLLTYLAKTKLLTMAPTIQVNTINEVFTDEEGNYWFTVDCSYSTGLKETYYFLYSPYLELMKMQVV